MPKIISVSRRTDIPAFYGDWFAGRLKEGFAGWENPFSGQKYLISLRPEDVTAFVFWSKNYQSFMKALNVIKSKNVPAMFNYTITGLPHEFENNLIEPEEAIQNLKQLSNFFSPEHINWRYDPILISNVTDEAFHLERFRWIASQLEGHVTRCYFSFAIMYGKVSRSFKVFQRENPVVISDQNEAWKLSLASKLTDIAEGYGIQMFSCCGDYLLEDLRIRKAHCVDGEILKALYPECLALKKNPTRKECGCTESSDIGKYNTCPHGCVYCYANINKEKLKELNESHDPDSVFLGYSRVESEKFMHEIEEKTSNKTKTLYGNRSS